MEIQKNASLCPIRVFAVNFTAPESQTVYGVPDSNGQFPPDQRFVKVRKQIDATNWDEATTWMDGLGRTVKTQAKDSQGDVFVETHYDGLGRVDRVTNPYRAGDTVYWSKTRYDELGRAIETFAPTELANLGSAQSLGVTSFDISTVPGFVGTVVTTTDASGRKGRSITNALGQLLRVDEPTAIGGTETADLGALATPHQPTFYHYPEPEENGDKRAYVVVRSDLETKDDKKKVATQFFDQLGRVRLSKTLEDPSTQSATSELTALRYKPDTCQRGRFVLGTMPAARMKSVRLSLSQILTEREGMGSGVRSCDILGRAVVGYP